jgi:predicted PurR-regulated permease PerM
MAQSLSKYLQLIFFAAVLLYVGKPLFVPLCFGLLVALIMHPICHWLEKRGCGRALAIALCLGLVSILFAGIFSLLVWQVSAFVKEMPQLFQKAGEPLQRLQQWLQAKAGPLWGTESNWPDGLVGSMASMARSVLNATSDTLFMLLLAPVFAALFMYHRRTWVRFAKLVTPAAYRPQVDAVLHQVIHTYFNYVKGMIWVYLIVGILNSIGLYALGVPNAILFGLLCAIMTIVPYIGIIASALLPISVVWLQTGNIWYPIGVVAVFGFVQYLEANVIFPKVVGQQLHVSTMAMLVAMLVGGLLWGMAGMVLFIPFVAILKIMSDNIAAWQPLNLLLGRQ